LSKTSKLLTQKAAYPKFLSGERRCLPEDCGGPPGYSDFIENIERPQSKKAREALKWYGGPYDPDEIDEEKILMALKRIARRRCSRSNALK